MKRAPLGEISMRKPLGEIHITRADTTDDQAGPSHQELHKQQQQQQQQQQPRHYQRQQQRQQNQEHREQNQSENDQDYPPHSEERQPYSLTHGDASSPAREEYSCTSDEDVKHPQYQGRQHILRSRQQTPERKSRQHYPEWCGPQRRGSRYLFSMIHRSQRIDLEREVSSAEELFETRPRLLWSENYDPNLSPDISDWDDEPILQPWLAKEIAAEGDDELNSAQHDANSSNEFDTQHPQRKSSAPVVSYPPGTTVPATAVEEKGAAEVDYEDFDEEPGEEADDERDDDDERPLRKRRRTPEYSGSTPAARQPAPLSKQSAASDEGYFDIIAASRLPCANDIPEVGPSSAAMAIAPVAAFHIRPDTPEIEKGLQHSGDNVESSAPSEKSVDIKESMDKENKDKENKDLTEVDAVGIHADGGKPDKENPSDVHAKSTPQVDLKEQLGLPISDQEQPAAADDVSYESQDMYYEDDIEADLSAYFDGDTKLSAVLNDEDDSDKENQEPFNKDDYNPNDGAQSGYEPVERDARATESGESDQENAPIYTTTLPPSIPEEDEESDKENQKPTYGTDEHLQEAAQESDYERESIESEVFIVGDDYSDGPSDKVDDVQVFNSKYPLYFDDSGFGHSECFDGACSPSGLVQEADSFSTREPQHHNDTPCTPLSRIGSRYSDAGLDAEFFGGAPHSDDEEQGSQRCLSTPRGRAYLSESVSEYDDDVASTTGGRTPPRKSDRLLYSDCPPTVSRGYTCEALVSVQEEHVDSPLPDPFSSNKAIPSRRASYHFKDDDNSLETRGPAIYISEAFSSVDKGHKHPRDVEYDTATNRESRRDDKRRGVQPSQPTITIPVPVGSVCDRGEIITPAVMQVYVPRRLDFSQPRAQPPLLRPFAGPLADARGWKAHQESVTIASSTTNTSTANTTAAAAATTTTTTATTTTNDAAWRICKVRVKTTLSAAELALQRK
ncbi:hypothetical protein EMPS_09180 [Entomortierella parvispora]|uniref:Uncharacterized protein n=1 Tax=Entomortierella parvispora TaxID=205924 RepID=A0A9P3HHP7_9FUNG|nr:hypothetical protein EMPS_09180 [Entomortierella parvispora]